MGLWLLLGLWLASQKFFLITFIFSSLCFSILNIFSDVFFDLTQSNLFKDYYFIIPISIFLISINQSIIVWLNRNKQYNNIATQNLIKSGSNSGSALFFGIKSMNTGLVLGHVISLISTSIFNTLHLLKDFEVQLINKKSMKRNFKKYIDFLKF